MLVFRVFLPSNFCGQRGAEGASSITWGHKWGVKYLIPFPHHHHHHHHHHRLPLYSLAADPAFFQWHGGRERGRRVDDDERRAACAPLTTFLFLLYA